MEIGRTIDEALYQYYVVENNLPVPNWRYIKDQDWWLEYLKDMGIDIMGEIHELIIASS